MRAASLNAFALAAVLSASPAHAVELPPSVADGGRITVDEARAHAGALYDAFAAEAGEPIARDAFIAIELPDAFLQGVNDRKALASLFDLVDADGDAAVTRSEWRAALDKDLAFADENGDGVVTLQELAKARENLGVGDMVGMIFS